MPAPRSAREEEVAMLKKSYSRNRKTCKVTFTLPPEAATGAESVHLVGDFNNWDKTSLPLKRSAEGSWETTLSLDAGREYLFRYCLDGTRWENDWNADKYLPSPYGDSDNSVVIV
jgi:1,4-alpha-glucan branching enzyme